MRRLLTRLAAAVLATSAAGLGFVAGTSAPADAAACSGASGVTVVVDHGALGGGVDQVCNPSGGGNAASSNFTGAGFALTYVQSQPGFVCRINGQPASAACVNTPPTNAYWGLFWSDGKSGSWSYASMGAGSLTIPDGGYVAFAWQTGSQNPPNVTPTPHASTPTPAPTPTPSPTSGGGGSGGGNGNGGGGGHGNGGGNGSATPTVKPSSKPPATSKPTVAPTATPSSLASDAATPDEASESASASATEKPTVAPSDGALPSASGSTSAGTTSSESASTTPVDSPDASSDDAAGALPAWVVPLVLLALAAGGGAAYVLRRRTRTSP